VQEEERKHLSRELHDEVGQALAAINMHLGMLQRNGTVDGRLLKKKIGDTLTLLAQTMETLHGFARELRPAMLDELGLLPALRSYLRNFAERTGLRVSFAASPEAERLNDEQKTVVYRVAQESLTNVAKHAHASRVTVRLRRLSRGLQLEIKDNGRAFKVDEQLSRKGRKRLGLLGMQERARLVNGRFAVKSRPGKGTAVSMEIPFKN
jgi:signal transduction histidine kinase